MMRLVRGTAERPVALIAMTLGLGMSSASHAREPQQVTLAYDIPVTAVSLGEPVVMTVLLRNESDAPVDIDLGQSPEDRFRYELRAPDGTTRMIQPTERLRLAPSGRGAVPPSLWVKHEVILDEHLDFGREGRYTLVVRFDGKVAPRSTAVVASVPRERTFNITVLPRDPERLRQFCALNLAETLAGPPRTTEAARRLIYVRDPVAIPFIRDMITTGGAYHAEEVWEAFLRIGSPEARQALEDIAGSSSPYASLAKRYLARFPRGRGR
jgi:hypothetical protein